MDDPELLALDRHGPRLDQRDASSSVVEIHLSNEPVRAPALARSTQEQARGRSLRKFRPARTIGQLVDGELGGFENFGQHLILLDIRELKLFVGAHLANPVDDP